MEIKLFTIPNIITLMNLVSGSMAVIIALTTGNMLHAALCIVLAAVFDFFDGFAARLLKQTSPLGVQLDSLADIVSFGLAPSVMLYATYNTLSPALVQGFSLAPVALILVAFSALRLAKFNIDTTQTTEFVGMPTPAAALFAAPTMAIIQTKGIQMPSEVIVVIAVVLALLLISPVRMFSLKFHGFGWAENKLRYSFLVVSVAMIAAMPTLSVPAIIVLYTFISVVRHFACSKSR